jgi:hypothetical protein
MTPSGMRGVLNDAVSIYFLDATLASAFVARWCAGYKIETAEGVFRIRDGRADGEDHSELAPNAVIQKNLGPHSENGPARRSQKIRP